MVTSRIMGPSCSRQYSANLTANASQKSGMRALVQVEILYCAVWAVLAVGLWFLIDRT
jgi:hypothetical protein